MTAPGQATIYFLQAVALGGILGLAYGALRPLGGWLRHLADGAFLLVAFWLWLYLAFAVCAGDIRLGYTAGMAVGCVLWDRTVGKLLTPVFSLTWRIVGFPLKNIWKLFRKFYKFLLAIGKKWVTMVGTNKQTGGVHRGQKAFRKTAMAEDQPRDQGCDPVGGGPVVDRSGGVVQRHRSAKDPL